MEEGLSATRPFDDTLYLKKGTYYLKLAVDDDIAEETAFQDYTVHITSVIPWPIVSDDNQSPERAAIIRPGKTYQDMLPMDLEHLPNYYSFSADKGTYYVTIKPESAYEGRCDMAIGNGEDRSAYGYVEDMKTRVIRITAAEPCQKIVSVDWDDFNYGNYTIRLDKLPDKPRAIKAAKAGKKARLTWTKSKGALGYQIYRSAKKSSGFKKIATRAQAQKASFTDSKAKKGRTYYYKLRPYIKVNGQIKAGPYTKTVKIKL